MESLLNTIAIFFNHYIFVYAMVVMLSYLLIIILSAFEMRTYLRKNSNTDYRSILVSEFAPSVSIIAPAYNEAPNIVDNVRSLLSLHYNKYEVIVVNDGSSDSTLDELIRAFDLKKQNYAINKRIDTQDVRGVFRSNNPGLERLIVLDKENGGKADALNAGINIAHNALLFCIDADCIIDPDAILKLVKPFMDEPVKVIAAGGVVRIANSCEINHGRLVKVHMPNSLLSRFQVLEYLRGFLLGRMAWSRINGLLIVSGAMGLFDKDIVIKCGGYSTKTVGEDMELVLRMRKYMHKHKIPYKVVYTPDPLCWTEAPSDLNILGRQRNRWSRGCLESLIMHRDLFFNPKYGTLGLISYPYWLLVEWMGPIIEFIGLIVLGILIYFGLVNWTYTIILLVMVYCFVLAISTLTILYEELSFRQYTSGKDLVKLSLLSFLEPFIYHPLILYWEMRGNFDFLIGKKAWGKMNRNGFR
jgi:cellulose synthase/poly-beta-1,6-N-acetylglucosamine synthase-like glycosyltransferase